MGDLGAVQQHRGAPEGQRPWALGGQESCKVQAGQCQGTEEQPPSGRDSGELGGLGGGRTRAWCRAGLRGSREDSASCPACLHHKHPENKCKQRDPALREPPTQPPPQRYYPMPRKSQAATNLGPRKMSHYLWSTTLATSDSYLPLAAERTQGTVCIVCGASCTVRGGAITLPFLVAKHIVTRRRHQMMHEAEVAGGVRAGVCMQGRVGKWGGKKSGSC